MSFNIIKSFVNDLIPLKCKICSKYGVSICNECIDKFVYHELDDICHVCRKLHLKNKSTCRSFISELYYPYIYDKRMSKLLVSLKYEFDESAFETISMLINHYLPFAINHDSAITYVPSHKFTVNIRGFNSAKEIAVKLANISGGRFITTLKKITYTKAQKTLDRKQRALNLENSFKALDSNNIDDITTLYLVDDVYTTGATMEECAKVIKTKYSHVKIVGIVFARGEL